MNLFDENILKFNEMYRLPAPTKPSVTSVPDIPQRLRDLKKILAEELDEIDDVIALAEQRAHPLDFLTALADLLGDVQVYCASEMRKFGLPNSAVLDLIMASNFSKLGADGKPIYDERGKVQKGPNYYKPEPGIRLLFETMVRE
jgi:predicted HAD superfamily Cof-like phosphohydrolase